MEAIHLLILDVCHHAVKEHPYSLVMSEFYHTTVKDKRPAVFGMTASLVNLKGVSSQEDCAIKIRNLEIKDCKELEKHVPMPSVVVVEYDKAANLWSLHEQIKQIEEAVEEAALTTLGLPKVFSELPSLSFVKCASLIGHNNNQEMRTGQMQDTIAKFRDGRVTLLVATSVAEEGLDIKQCNVVIRFGLAKMVLAYIQSRGVVDTQMA
ncbi:hypothetical protein H6P81_004215 [Aristolochia fimbriata]|uniref:Helicase C-terminal domain-containing protein n=1 Tax=Aristolochia fimbriata TaxID=158543 RepID=A0AAV7FHV4_ARIFI|nr:hypothetical protein H6P81_004215 [Aristolochia fimbriata]